MKKRFFTRISAIEPDGEMPTINDKELTTEKPDCNISKKDIETFLGSLKSDKLPALDKMHPYILKEMNSAKIIPLELIFSLSLLQKNLPYD